MDKITQQQLDTLEAEKRRLESGKLELEIRDLSRPWYLRSALYFNTAIAAAAILGLVVQRSIATFELERKILEQRVAEQDLREARASLGEELNLRKRFEEQTQELAGVKGQLDLLSTENSQLRQTTQELKRPRIEKISIRFITGRDDKECGAVAINIKYGDTTIVSKSLGGGQKWESGHEEQIIEPINIVLDEKTAITPTIALQERPGEKNITWDVRIEVVVYATGGRELRWQSNERFDTDHHKPEHVIPLGAKQFSPQ